MGTHQSRREAEGLGWLLWRIWAGAIIGLAVGVYVSSSTPYAIRIGNAELQVALHKHLPWRQGQPPTRELVEAVHFYQLYPEAYRMDMQEAQHLGWVALFSSFLGAGGAFFLIQIIADPGLILALFKSGGGEGESK